MKKVFLLNMMCLMALTMQAQNYVDLGLPSGTKWKATNEKNAADAEYDFFTYDEAVSQFGDRLPTKHQYDELKAECKWTWTGSGYKVTGPNGNFITLPAAGFRVCVEGVDVDDVGSYGGYWSSTPFGSDYAWSFGFFSDSVGIGCGGRCGGRSVRLVQD